MSLNLDNSTWKRVSFGDAIENVTDRVDDPSEAGVDRYVGLEHLDPGVMTVQRWDTPDKVEAQKLRFQPGDVVFGRRRAYQKKVALADFEGICSAHALVLRARPDYVHPDFLPVFLSSDYFLDRAIAISVGSLSPTVNWRDLKVQEFDLPPLGEQKRIADLLWALERHCRRLSELDNLLEYAQSAFIDGFLRRAGAEWPVKRLADLTTKISDGVHKRPSYVDSGVPFLTVENLTRGDGIDFKDVRYVSSEDHAAFIKRTQPERGDVLVSKDGTLGVARVVDTDIDFSIFVSIALLKPVRRLLEPGYLRAYFDSRQFRSILSAKTSGSALKHIHLVDFRGTEIPVPPLELQQEFVAELSVIQAARDRTHGERASLAALRSSFLADIFGSN